jgi:hypothetical protein
MQLEQLKAITQLKKWEGLRFNLQAKGHSALEIPAFAWEIINNVIEGDAAKKNGDSSKKAEP